MSKSTSRLQICFSSFGRMDLSSLLEDASSMADDPEAKKRKLPRKNGPPPPGGTPSDNKELKKLKEAVVLLTKLGLSHAQQMRTIRAILLDVIMMLEESEWMKDIVEAGQKYASLMPDSGRDAKIEKMVLIHHHAWNALITIALKQAQGEQAKKIQDYISHIKIKGGIHGFQRVKTVMREKAWERGAVKLLVNVMPGTIDYDIWQIVKGMLVKSGGRALPGKAPPGKMEELLQSMLEEFRGQQPSRGSNQ